MSDAPRSSCRRRAYAPSDAALLRGAADTARQHLFFRHSVGRFACPARDPNTTKCESEKLTPKLAAIAQSLAAGTGSQSDTTTSTVVLVTNPAIPDATNAAKARQRNCLPDSRAKVT